MKRLREDELRRRKFAKIEKSDEIRSSSVFAQEHTSGMLPDSVGYGFIIFFLILIKFFYTFENALPDQIKIRDADSHPGRFIGERAQLQLKRLTNLGTRVVGSYENEVLAVDFLKREISFITQESNKIHKVEIDIQRPTGSYFLTFKPNGFRNYYTNIQNIVVKLSSGNSTNSILMNCHYDTVPESPGASDNGLNCVVMLEILRILASESVPLKNNVIFLFNGAEENPLQASHGFLSQHKWRNEVKVVINLDSAGAGGREILFQTSGEPWLAKAYAKAVPRPTAGVQAEELFHYGIIPSDTDFRIFRDFAGYPGYDIAHCSNGYVYHTRLDTMDYIRPGVYQNTGDNMLALVRELVNSPELDATHSKTRLVYFDLFTLFMVVYTEKFGIVLNLAAVALSFFAVFKSLKRFTGGSRAAVTSLGVAIGGQLLGLALAMAFVFVTSKTLDIYRSTMSWYLRPSLILPLYSFPIVFTLATVLLMTQAYMRKLSLGLRIINFINGAQLLWTVVLLVGSLKRIRSSFILMLIVLFPSLGTLFITLFKRQPSVRAFVLMYLCCAMFPILYSVNMAVKVFTVMIPMTARMGPHTNPETIIGVLAFITSTIYLSQIVPLLLFLKNLKKFLLGLCIIYIIAMVGVMTTKHGFPYSGDVQSPALQRFYILHCDRTFHDGKGAVRKADSGFFVQSLDRNNVNFVSESIPELRHARVASEDCEREIFCGFPIFTSRFIRPAPYSYWLPAAPPTIHHPTSFEIVNQTQVLVAVRRIRILITGPDHITVGLSPRQGIELVRWSFEDTIPVDLESQNGRKTYMVYYSHGLMGGSLEFDVDLRVSPNGSDHLMDVAVIGHYMHDAKFRTNEFKLLLSRFPNWAHLTAWTTTYKSWVV